MKQKQQLIPYCNFRFIKIEQLKNIDSTFINYCLFLSLTQAVVSQFKTMFQSAFKHYMNLQIFTTDSDSSQKKNKSSSKNKSIDKRNKIEPPPVQKTPTKQLSEQASPDKSIFEISFKPFSNYSQQFFKIETMKLIQANSVMGQFLKESIRQKYEIEQRILQIERSIKKRQQQIQKRLQNGQFK